ncbi:MAG: CHAT domain-containing protein [Marinibacterium sp.]|nr:CHAT domain-containing protein [Marinibacterium sp.]
MTGPSPFETDSLAQSQAEIRALRYVRAADLLARARATTDSAALRRAQAVALGASVEYRMRLADALQVIPPPEICSTCLRRLDTASRLDPTIADLPWNMAVLHGRFTGDHASAARALERAQALGMSHPMMARLHQMIASDTPAPTPGPGPTAALHRLLFSLIDLTADGDGPADFDSILSRARHLARQGADTAVLHARFGALRSASLVTSDALDYGLEFVSCAADAGEDPQAARDALAEVTGFLTDFSFHISGTPAPSASDLRKAARLARRGLDMAAASPADLDPDRHGDLWLALGQATGRPEGLDMAQAFDAYARAFKLKRAAGNSGDQARLRDLLTRMLDHAVHMGLSADLGLGSLGRARSALQAGFAAAKVVGDPDQIRAIGLRYNMILSAVSQPHEALRVLDELLSDLPASDGFDLRLERAMRLSEQRDLRAALRAHEDLQDRIAEQDAATRCLFWNSYYNTLRDLDRMTDALAAIDSAIAAQPDDASRFGPMLHSNRGRILLALQRPDAAATALQSALDLMTDAGAGSFDTVRIAGLRARIALDQGDAQAAHDICQGAIAALQQLLTRGDADPRVWVSMLQEWSRLDGLGLRCMQRAGRPATEALAFAEAAKGRMMRLLTQGCKSDHARHLQADCMDPAVDGARAWVRAHPGRLVLSLFCSSDGIMLLRIAGPKGDVSYRTQDGAGYDRFRDNVYFPWEELTDWSLDRGVQQALAARGAPPELLLGAAETMGGLMLDRLGSLLDHLAPELRAGGRQIVIVPHRVMRSLPLAQARLPGGACLSELFDEVSIIDTLADLQGRPAPPGTGAPRLFLDPAGDLPFARLEPGLLDRAETAMGPDATRAAFSAALAGADPVLVSAHGQFLPDNPWASSLAFADGPLTLADLMSERDLSAPLMILSCCEAGLAQRSNSDEPFGFPAILRAAGLASVIAPAWRVDDLATCLYVSRLLQLIAAGMPPARATSRAGHWLRDLSARDARSHLARLARLAPDPGTLPGRRALAEQERWLSHAFDGPETPFQAPLYWAAFQHFGLPSDPPSDPEKETCHDR